MKLHQDSKRPRLRESRWSTLITISPSAVPPLGSKISLSSVSSRASTKLPREVSRITLSQAFNNRWLTLITVSRFKHYSKCRRNENPLLFIFQILSTFFSFSLYDKNSNKPGKLDRSFLRISRSILSLLFHHLTKIILPIGERCNHQSSSISKVLVTINEKRVRLPSDAIVDVLVPVESQLRQPLERWHVLAI